MFLVDDILMAPARGLLWVFKEIHRAVEQEQANEVEAITTKLSELYMMLETGQMTEVEFDAAEKTLLDRLDAIKETAADQRNEEDKEEEVIVVKRNRKKVKIPLNFKAKRRSRHSRAEHVLAIGDVNPGDVVAKAVNNERRLIPGLRPE